MSRQVVGEPRIFASTSMTFSFPEAGTLHKLVEVTCNRCQTSVRTFDRRMPDGWTEHYWGMGKEDLCPTCSSVPSGDAGDTYA